MYYIDFPCSTAIAAPAQYSVETAAKIRGFFESLKIIISGVRIYNDVIHIRQVGEECENRVVQNIIVTQNPQAAATGESIL